MQATHDTHGRRFIIGDAFLQYDLNDGIYDFVHTEVPPHLQGKGLASSLVKQAVEEIGVNQKQKIIPSCTFVHKWFLRNEQYRFTLAANL